MNLKASLAFVNIEMIVMKHIKWLLFSLVAFTLAGCTMHSVYQPICRQVPVAPYKYINVDGPVNVVLTREPVGTPIKLTGSYYSLKRAGVQVNDRNQTLYITKIVGGYTPTGPVTIKVPVGHMKVLTATLKDNSNMQAKNIRFDKVNIKTDDLAHAAVYARYELNAVAKGSSSIFYYSVYFSFF